MVRWEPDAGGRLQRAALDLYSERGFEATTVQDIADRVGVTERTFFRYFADKREVLFDGSHLLEQAVVDGVKSAPASAPIAMAEHGLAAAAGFFDESRRSWSTQRAAIIDANPSLRERELLKLATMGAAIAEALRGRGVPDSAAAVAADLGMAAFHQGFQRWVLREGGDGRDFAGCLNAAFDDVVAVASGAAATATVE